MKKLLIITIALILMSGSLIAQPSIDGGIKNWGVWEDSIVTDAGQTVDDTSAVITLGNYNHFMLWSYAKNKDGTADSVRIKAAGGVRTLDDVLRVRALGVTRVGATATEAILEEAKKRGYL